MKKWTLIFQEQEEKFDFADELVEKAKEVAQKHGLKEPDNLNRAIETLEGLGYEIVLDVSKVKRNERF